MKLADYFINESQRLLADCNMFVPAAAEDPCPECGSETFVDESLETRFCTKKACYHNLEGIEHVEVTDKDEYFI